MSKVEQIQPDVDLIRAATSFARTAIDLERDEARDAAARLMSYIANPPILYDPGFVREKDLRNLHFGGITPVHGLDQEAANG